jgi:beta-glucosidase
LIKDGKVSEKSIDEAVKNILRLKFSLGLFDNPYINVDAPSPFYAEEHLAKAKEAAVQSTVLLKNDNQVLPLSDNIKRVAVIGPMSDAPHDQLGCWTFDGDKTHTQTPIQAFQKEYPDVTFLFEKTLDYSRDNNTGNFSKAVAAAKQSDVVLVFAGEEAILSGEARCRADLDLPGMQKALIAELKKAGKPIVLIVMAGRPLTITDEVEMSDAVLYAWHPGTMGGPALADLIFGKAVPSGKLPVTFPRMVGQIPIYYNHKNTGRPAAEHLDLINDIPVGAPQTSLGHTCYYLDAGDKPLFPFGYGLSYTTFEYGKVNLSSKEITSKDTLSVSCEIKNTGKYDAAEVVQLYIRDEVASLVQPVKVLKAFERINLKAGESRSVTFKLSADNLAFWNKDMKKVAEPGSFTLWVGGNSQQGDEIKFELK